MFAYIPARGNSQRIKRKNIRKLGGKPIILHVIETLQSIRCLTGIAVSSEDPEIIQIVRSHGIADTLEPRDARLAEHSSTFVDLAREDAPRFSRHFSDQNIFFITATAAMVRSTHIYQAINILLEQSKGLVLGATEYSVSPALALQGSPEIGLTALFPEMYTKPTADLQQYYSDSGCFYAFSLDRLEGAKKFLDIQPVRAVVLPQYVGIDLDTEIDWQRLEKAFHERSDNQPKGFSNSRVR